MRPTCLGSHIQDRAIIATAIPKITTEFNSPAILDGMGRPTFSPRAASSSCSESSTAELSIKWVFIAALGIFELGSLICALAPNSIALIVGRAVAGLGCSGIVTGALIMLAASVPRTTGPRSPVP